MAQPAMATAGSMASRSPDFPNDHPATLIAVSSPARRQCRATHEKSHTRVSRTASVTTAHVRITPHVNNYPARKWFHATSTYCGGGATGMELRMCGSYIGSP
jgi:hypothetical protein